MARFDRAIWIGAGTLALLAAACQLLVGLDRFEKVDCTTDCDANVLETSAPPDGGADADGGGIPLTEAGLAYRWAHWPMPNPADAETDANRASYTASVSTIKDGGFDGALTEGGAPYIETVFDNVTKLTWAKPYSEGVDYIGATAYCQSLAAATGDGFRLPTRIELVSILDYTGKSVAIDPAFGATEGTVFWTQSVALGDTQGVWVLAFNKDGTLQINPPTQPARARCVR